MHQHYYRYTGTNYVEPVPSIWQTVSPAPASNAAKYNTQPAQTSLDVLDLTVTR